MGAGTMTRKEKQLLRRHQSTRQLMDIDQIADHELATSQGELVFFLLHPFNLSVQSQDSIRNLIENLTNVFRGVESMELMTLDSRESFQQNKEWYLKRLEEETIPGIRALLQKDMAHLDEIQLDTASAREFALVMRFPNHQEASLLNLTQIEKSVHEQGFRIRIADADDLKRLLAVYYEQNVTSEIFDDVDGERWVDQADAEEENKR